MQVDLLRRWQKAINLVSRGSLNDVWRRHVWDSAQLMPHIPDPTAPILDIGSGAGFPGLALKCALPGFPITLAEPRQKRVSFLKHVIRTLKLTEIEVWPHRIEPDPDTSHRFPLITSRAFADIVGFLTACQQLSSANGVIICMKGPKYEEEIAAWRNSPMENRFRLADIETHRLPFSKKERYLVIFEKKEL